MGHSESINDITQLQHEPNVNRECFNIYLKCKIQNYHLLQNLFRKSGFFSPLYLSKYFFRNKGQDIYEHLEDSLFMKIEKIRFIIRYDNDDETFV